MPRAAPIDPVVFRNPVRADSPVEVLSFAELRRKAPAGYLAKPQRPTFHQLFVPTRGSCIPEIDFEAIEMGPGAVAWIRPGQVQRFDIERGVEGWLVLFTREFLERGFEEPLAPSIELGDTAPDVLWLIDRIRRFAPSAPNGLLRHLLHSLLALVRWRSGDVQSETASVFALLRAEVEKRFAQTREVQEYARLIGYSVKTLSRSTQTAAGLSAKAYIDQRVILESKRLLAYTDLGTHDIASRVGFSEATNFIKFFQREAKESPTAFRVRSRA